MIRFMGFATGAAVAVGFMLFLFGAPQAPDAEAEPLVVQSQDALPTAAAEIPTTDTPASEPAAETLEAPVKPVEPVEPEASLEPAALETPPVEAAAATVPIEEVPNLAGEPEADTRIAVADDAPQRDLQWHVFWSPFRSRIAANGFVSRLESVTGFDYRVVHIDTGVYEVAVGYADDDERRNKLAAIAEATGLEMPDS